MREARGNGTRFFSLPPSLSPASMTYFEIEIPAVREEKQIGHPSGKNRGHHAAAAERNGNRIGGPVEKSDDESLTDADGHAPSTYAGSPQTQRDADDGHDDTDERKRDTAMEFREQTGDIISAP